MQFTTFLAAAVLSATSVFGQQGTVTSWGPAQQTMINSDTSNYLSSLMAQPNWSSISSVLATASNFPPILSETYPANQAVSFLNAIITGTPVYMGALPTGVQSWVSSVASAEASIINKDATANAAQPTVRMVAAMGAGLAAGVGVVMAL